MNSTEQSSVSQNLPTLRKLVRLPAEPQEVWFEQIPRGKPGGFGPTDYFLVAVMRFDRKSLIGLLKSSAPTGDKSPGILSSVNRSWFPGPVKAAIRPSDDQTVSVRGQEFDAAPFASGAFSSGSFIAVDGGEYLLLVLATS